MMQYDERQEMEFVLDEGVQELSRINKKIASLLLKKEELTQVIIGALGHEHEGQKTYEHGAWKIEVKTPCVYSLDKKRYESMEYKLPKKYNPIKTSVSYTIDKKKCDELLHDAPEEIRDVLIDVIEKRPGKSSVVLKERV